MDVSVQKNTLRGGIYPFSGADDARNRKVDDVENLGLSGFLRERYFQGREAEPSGIVAFYEQMRPSDVVRDFTRCNNVP